MGRAIVAALLSGLVMPGMGQLFNRQPLKALGLILATTVVLLSAMGMLSHKLSKAMMAVGGGPGGWEALRAQLVAQGMDWIWWWAGAFGVIWAYGVWDAWRWGSRSRGEGE